MILIVFYYEIKIWKQIFDWSGKMLTKAHVSVGQAHEMAMVQ